jgi:hypothetical protein
VAAISTPNGRHADLERCIWLRHLDLEDEDVRGRLDNTAERCLEGWPIDQIDNIPDILFVGHAFEGFFRESDESAEALGELTV